MHKLRRVLRQTANNSGVPLISFSHYEKKNFNSYKVFSISTTVRVQYISFFGMSFARMYDTISESKHTVLPVPVGISRMQWPGESRVLFNSRIYSSCSG